MEDIDKAIYVLNSVSEADPCAVHNMLIGMMPVNQKIVDHPTMRVYMTGNGPISKPIDLLNSVLFELTGEMVSLDFEDTGKEGFIKFRFKGVKKGSTEGFYPSEKLIKESEDAPNIS